MLGFITENIDLVKYFKNFDWSILLFIMATSSITKYFDRKITGNLIVSIISIILGILLIFVPKSIMYTLFKVVGVYIIVMIII